MRQGIGLYPTRDVSPLAKNYTLIKLFLVRGKHAPSNSTGQIYPIRSMCQKPISTQIQTASQLGRMVQHHHCLNQHNGLQDKNVLQSGQYKEVLW